jgi:hypothetical protein
VESCSGDFIRPESEWKLEGNAQAVAQLRLYVDSVRKKLPILQKEAHTNWNESFFARVARANRKDTCKPVAWEFGSAVQVLVHNWGCDWVLRVREEPGFEALGTSRNMRIRQCMVRSWLRSQQRHG